MPCGRARSTGLRRSACGALRCRAVPIPRERINIGFDDAAEGDDAEGDDAGDVVRRRYPQVGFAPTAGRGSSLFVVTETAAPADSDDITSPCRYCGRPVPQ